MMHLAKPLRPVRFYLNHSTTSTRTTAQQSYISLVPYAGSRLVEARKGLHIMRLQIGFYLASSLLISPGRDRHLICHSLHFIVHLSENMIRPPY